MQFTISDPADRLAILQNWKQGANAIACEIHGEKAVMRFTGDDTPDNFADGEVFIEACCAAQHERVVARCREIEETRGGN